MSIDPFHCAFSYNQSYNQIIVCHSDRVTDMPPASIAFFTLVWFQHSRERLCINQVKTLLSVCGMLLGYNFEPRPNSCALASAGMVMTIGLSINGCFYSKKLVWRERTRLTNPEVWAAATSKAWHNSGRDTFSPPWPRRQKDQGSACRVGYRCKQCTYSV